MKTGRVSEAERLAADLLAWHAAEYTADHYERSQQMADRQLMTFEQIVTLQTYWRWVGEREAAREHALRFPKRRY